LATVGRTLIQQKQQAALANIRASKKAALNHLNIKYASADKAKQSFGFIGITFLSVIFGSIILNDLIKLCAYICDEIGETWSGEKTEAKNNSVVGPEKEIIDEEACTLEMDLDLEEILERVYFRLKANQNKK